MLTAEAHQARHRALHAALVEVIALYEAHTGQSQGRASVWDLLQSVQDWATPPTDAQWRACDELLADYIRAQDVRDWMKRGTGMLSGTRLMDLHAWSRWQCAMAEAVGDEED